MRRRGYAGKVLFVNLSNGSYHEEVIADEIYERYLSGIGLAAKILYERIPPHADPLGPENILGFVSGILTGSGAVFSGRWMVVGKSPLTGGWGDANAGGDFAPAIKRCGYDAIFFTGTSSHPVYLHIANNGSIALRDASEYWGKDAVEAEDALKATHSSRAGVAVIGTAGENASLISGICNDRGRIAARSGLGAVMGSKKLKALVLEGAYRIAVHNHEGIKEISRSVNRYVAFQPPLFSGKYAALLGSFMRLNPLQMAMDGMVYKMLLKRWGTSSMNQMSIEMGDSPVKNWAGSNEDLDLKQSSVYDPDVILQREKLKYHCNSCPLGCGGICSMPNHFQETHKPEYESIMALGGLCMNKDMESIFYLNEMLNRAGMDTISAGATVAFAIECFENGLLTKEQTDGLVLQWGNTGAVVALIQKMIKREGFGDLLADGVAVASKRIGEMANSYAITAGKQELPMHDGRNDPGFNLHYSVEAAPGKHTIGAQLYYEMFQLHRVVPDLPKVTPLSLYRKGQKYIASREKAQMAAACSSFMNVVNSAGLCLFGTFIGVHRVPVFKMLNEVTGWHNSPKEYLQIGARLQTLKQMFNVKHGIEPLSLRVHSRAEGIPPLGGGANKGRGADMGKMMADYWREFAWDTATGKPTLDSLVLHGLASYLEDYREELEKA
ncbi:MAG: aldehyde ferredoxin oxidoreductase family protein [Deltaproteobacteria bacterium]|nr:aldehyde ferredoxin oxidoreductase family protein [Deltaproteobacteria bacterium]